MTFDAVLEARERRYFRQVSVIERFGTPLVSLTVVTPGARKDTESARKAFLLALHSLRSHLADRRFPVVYEAVGATDGGTEALFAVAAEPHDLKRMLVAIEEIHPVGRLFDFDVITTARHRVSRTELGFPPRRCLLCARPYFECVRQRAHPVDALIQEIDRIMALVPFRGDTAGPSRDARKAPVVGPLNTVDLVSLPPCAG